MWCGASQVVQASSSGPIVAPLRADPISQNYFKDPSGKVVYLVGSHTWNAFQDWGTNDSPVPFDFDAYVEIDLSPFFHPAISGVPGAHLLGEATGRGAEPSA
jgi:hypothetical protein